MFVTETNLKWSGLLLPLLLIPFLAGCQSTSAPPITEEDVSPAETPREKGLWEMADRRVKQLKNSGLVRMEKDLNTYLKKVGTRVIPDSAREKVSFSFYVIQHPVPNAFAFPNGAIFLHTGLLSRMRNEAQLATILAHEAVHVIHRHTLEHMANMENKLGTLRWISTFTAPIGDIGDLTYALGRLFTIAAIFGFSRDLEREADKKGFDALVDAGYDPEQAPAVFKLLNLQLDEERDQPPYLYATHPRNAERRRYLRTRAEAHPDPDGDIHRKRFLRKTRSVRIYNARRNIERFWPRTARYELDLLKHRKPEPPGLLLARARTFFYAEEPDVDRALKLARKAINGGYEGSDVERFLGRIYLRKHRPKKARTHLRRYLEQRPDAPRKFMIEHMIERTKQ